MDDALTAKLPKKLYDVLGDLAGRLSAIYGEGLVSVILYGSAASGEYSRRHSNINLAIILSDTSMANIAKAKSTINMRSFAMINPVFFTEDYLKRSVDVFPIEFLDMKENHIVLRGKDLVNALNIDTRNLRFQCEQELKSKLLNIKGAYLKSRGRSSLEGILFKYFTSVMHIVRNLVRLKGKTPAYAKEDILEEVYVLFNIDTGNMRKILAAKNRAIKLSRDETERLLFAFTSDLEKITAEVDRL